MRAYCVFVSRVALILITNVGADDAARVTDKENARKKFMPLSSYY